MAFALFKELKLRTLIYTTDSSAQILKENIADDIKKKIMKLEALRCPEHGLGANIICKGRSICELIENMGIPYLFLGSEKLLG